MVVFETLPEIKDRIEKILSGEYAPEATATGGEMIPAYYGAVDGSGVYASWHRMWDRMRASRPTDEAFYLSNLVGWASRP